STRQAARLHPQIRQPGLLFGSRPHHHRGPEPHAHLLPHPSQGVPRHARRDGKTVGADPMTLSKQWLPRSIECLHGYTTRKFSHDLVAGLTVGLVALPLAMAFALASGLPPL